MAKYQIFIGVRNGGGQAIINGNPNDPQGYESGSTVSFNWVTSATYSAISIYTRDNYISPQSSPSFTFTMPERDITFYVELAFYTTPPAPYGIKYFYEWCDTVGVPKRIDIKERDYTGTASKRMLNNVIRRFGDRDSDPTEIFTFSSMDITFVSNSTEYEEFLTGDIRRFQVVLYVDGDIVFKGYIKPDYITSPEKTNVNHEIKLTAFDGMDDFKSIRFEWSLMQNRSALSGFADFSQPAIKAIARALNQSYEEGRPINISCDLYETRMDPSDGMFEQWVYGNNAIFTDGKDPRFIDDSSKKVVNEQFNLEQVLTRLINPFLCNIYLWNDEFYIVRIEEITKDEIRFFKYASDNQFIESYTIDNNQQENCILANGIRTGRTVYTEFKASLRLGVLLSSAGGGDFLSGFEIREWVGLTYSTQLDVNFKLREWAYVKSVPFNSQTQGPRTGNLASIQYWTEEGNEYCRMWTTTNSSGLADPNLSWIEKTLVTGGMQTLRGGSNPPFIALSDANVVVFECDWMLKRATAAQAPRPTGYEIAFQIQIGNYYLYQDGSIFDWTTTPTIISFPILVDVNTMNEIRIFSEPIVESGSVILRLYQLVNTNPSGKDNYLIDWNFANIKIQENQALVLTEIQKMAITKTPYSKIYPTYQTFLGDTITNQSTSAMRLLDGEVTQEWGEDEVGLLDNILQELANLFGKSNVSVYGNMIRSVFEPFKALRYKGRFWKVNHMMIDESKGELNNVDLFDLGPLPEPDNDVTISWEVNEGIPNISYIDANMRIYVNEVMLVEEWTNNTGELNLLIGDTVRVQWFFLQGLIDADKIDPYLQLLVDGSLYEEHAINPATTQTYNYIFTATANDYSIFVRSIDKG